MINSQRLKQSTAVLFTSLSLLSVTALFEQLPINTLSQRVLAQTADEQLASRVYQRVNPAVVTLKTRQGHGSGFIVSKDGLIVTNAHVVDNEPNVVTVVFSDGRQVPADVIGFSKGGLDLAVLKISNQRNLTTVALATPGSVKVGHRVFAIGTPLDPNLNNTFTQGNISRIDQKQGTIQHTANISPGNSGGPLLNSQGEVIGVNESVKPGIVKDGQGNIIGITPHTGIAFAISVDRIQSFLTAARQRQLSPISTLPTPREPAPPTPISLNGQVIKGNLGEEDGSYFDSYVFEGEAGQKVKLEMDSQEFNPFLILYQVKEVDGKAEYLKVADNDDKGPGNLNAQIASTLPEDGVYLVLATSLAARESGKYSFQAAANP